MKNVSLQLTLSQNEFDSHLCNFDFWALQSTILATSSFLDTRASLKTYPENKKLTKVLRQRKRRPKPKLRMLWQNCKKKIVRSSIWKKQKVANSPSFAFFFLNFAWSISSNVDSPAVALVAKRVHVGRKRCPKTSTRPPSPATRPLVSKGFVDLEKLRPIKVESEDSMLNS